jgi:hypothetical protein
VVGVVSPQPAPLIDVVAYPINLYGETTDEILRRRLREESARLRGDLGGAGEKQSSGKREDDALHEELLVDLHCPVGWPREAGTRGRGGTSG